MPFFVRVTGSFRGKHFWPDAPPKHHLLRILHEHNFGFVVEIREVAPREIEFLALAQQISDLMTSYLQYHPQWSCEDMARVLFERLVAGWMVPARRVASVEINEDGGCGAIYREDPPSKSKTEVRFANPNIQALYEAGSELMDKGLL